MYLTSNEIASEMQDFDIVSVVHAKLHPWPGTFASTSPYEWWDWRACPVHRWRLKNLMDPTNNPGPYTIPVLCGQAASDSGLTQGGSEDNIAFLRRVLLHWCGLDSE